MAADLEAASRRREARRQTLEVDIERSERKLANPGFMEKAPPEVVQAEREKCDELRRQLETL